MMNPSIVRKTAYGALLFGSLVFVSTGPALAKLQDPGQGHVIGGGFCRGLPLGPKAASSPRERIEASEVAGERCYLVPSRVLNAAGDVSTRLVRMCE